MGMVGAMLVLFAVIGAYVAFRAVNRTEPESQVRAVDYQQTLEYARQTDFPVLAPASLPDGWRATSADFVPKPARWHLGLLTDENRYVGIEQSRGSLDDMVETYVDRNAVPGKAVEVDGERWRTWTDSGGDTALGRVEGDVTTLVVGTTGLDVLVDFTETLR
jgi:hypothetical protein